MKNRLSVIIPAYNSEKTISICLDSIYCSSYLPEEVIVVDDASSDNTVDIVKKYPCRLLKNKKNKGQSASRNKGAKISKGNLLLFIDSDIEIKKDSIKQAVNSLMKNTDICGVVGTYDKYNRYDNLLSQYKHFYMVFLYLSSEMHINWTDTAFLLIKKKDYLAVGGLDESIKESVNEDYKLGIILTQDNRKILLDKQVKIAHHRHLDLKKFTQMEYLRGRNGMIINLTNIFFRKLKDKALAKTFKISLALTPLIYLFFLLSLFIARSWPAIILIILVLTYLLINIRFLSFLSKEKSLFFVISSFFIIFFDMTISLIGGSAGLLKFILGERI